MKVLYLGNDYDIDSKNKIYVYLKLQNIDIYYKCVKINVDYIKANNFDLIISYRYRYIISKEIIILGIPIINLHISYLPWNKGADPNLWSFIDDTKKGITIHLVDEHIDTGSILYQKELFTNKTDILEETLESTYNILNDEIQNLFIENFNDIINRNYIPKIQNTLEGTYHKSTDKNHIMETILLNNKWKIKISNLYDIINNIKV